MSQLFCQGKFFRISAVAALLMLLAASAWSASYKVLFNFNRTSNQPSSGLIFDAQGNAYGTTWMGGHNNAGSVYQLSPTTGYHLLYPFAITGPNGENPQGNLMFDSSGNLYGTTVNGGPPNTACPGGACGVVFKISPSSNGGVWTETVLYDFCSQLNCSDGFNPESGVIADSQGNLFGTASGGKCCGLIFELSPPSGGIGPWTETVLYNFCSLINCEDGELPYGGLIFDSFGNLYGTTTMGGAGDAGTVFELSPTGNGWTETVLHNFETNGTGDGGKPYGGLALDASGNLYGTTIAGGNPHVCSFEGCGIVFELTPTAGADWTETILHTFTGRDGANPYAGVVLDTAGDVYGTAYHGGASGSGCGTLYCGTVFKLTPSGNGSWNAGVFRFPNEEAGYNPLAPVALGSDGNVYGTTSSGGTGKGGGVVFGIAQP
jgi:uncharacterized repeat protein (TIGR03803 family)